MIFAVILVCVLLLLGLWEVLNRDPACPRCGYRHNVPMYDAMPHIGFRTCLHCGKEFDSWGGE